MNFFIHNNSLHALVHATSYIVGDFENVKMGNHSLAKAISIRDLCLSTNNGTILILKNVKHIPDICMNLISTSKLDDEVFCNTFNGG